MGDEKKEEIEITPEMIKAGVRAMSGFNEEYDGRDDLVVWIYEAMREIAKKAECKE